MAVVGATRGEETLPVRLLRGAVGGLLAGLVFAAVTMWFADSTAGKADMPRMISTIVKGDLARPGGRRGGVLRRPARPVAAGRRRPGQDPGGRRAARWRRHAAGLTGGDRRRPVAPGTVVERAGRAPLGADGRGVARHGQGGGRTARGRHGPRPTRLVCSTIWR